MVDALHAQRISIVGGCGHVGLPLGIALAEVGAGVSLIDLDAELVARVNGGQLPFIEAGGQPRLEAVLTAGRLRATTDNSCAATADALVFVTGTPVDEHLNPKLSDVFAVVDSYLPQLRAETLIIMRSTLAPGTMTALLRRLSSLPFTPRLAFCPERVAQGQALEEIGSLPQLVAAFDDDSYAAAANIFAAIAPCLVRLAPGEAELAKLMTNTWRYLEFAIANQFYMLAEAHGIDFYRLYDALRYGYGRCANFAAPGFTAGPCLFKDTMQLASSVNHQFFLGHAAMLVNEGMAQVVVDRARRCLGGDLAGRRIGILGMTFKANSDDTRDALSFKVRKLLETAGAEVLISDPYLPQTASTEAVLSTAELIIIGVLHDAYRDLQTSLPVVDIWGHFGRSPVAVAPGTRS